MKYLILALLFLVAASAQAQLVRQPGSDLPSGTIIQFAGATCPAGFVAADGSQLSNVKYKTLCNVLGSYWGAGTSTTCKGPDLRNRSLRGIGTNGDGNGGDAVALGQYQADDFKSHKHSISDAGVDVYIYGILNNGAHDSTGDSGTINAYTNSTGGNETRPKAYGVLYCVKY